MPSLKQMWADPVWSKVIAGVILATGGIAISYFMNWWPAIGANANSALNFVGQTSPVPNWLIGLGGICSSLVLFVLAVVIWQLVFSKQEESQNTWRSYVTDIFFDLRWHWRYGSDGGIYNLYSCCKTCDYQVHPENSSGYAAVTRLVFRCDVCRREVGPFEEEPFEIESKVRRHIQQKLRTGAWNAS